MKLVLDKCAHLLAPNTEINGQSQTPLLVYISGGGATTEGLSMLLGRGADIPAQDKNGATCLHIYFDSSMRSHRGGPPVRSQDALDYLVRNGADVFAADHAGRTVSSVAYCTEGESSFMGDVWDRVLAGNGFDVASFRREYGPRRARYATWYTRGHFERLWEGCADLCPYYHSDEEPLVDKISSIVGDGDAENEALEDGDEGSPLGKRGSEQRERNWAANASDGSSDTESDGGCMLE
jgi:hypothetical protein